MQPKVSVIVAVYNIREYLPQCIALGGAVQDEQREIGGLAALHVRGGHHGAALPLGDEEGGKARPGHRVQFSGDKGLVHPAAPEVMGEEVRV